MVRVGFIVEGDSEKIIIESPAFRQFLAAHGHELITPVIDAKGGGNLLPQNIDAFISVLEAKNVEQIFVLTDLEDEPTTDAVHARIGNERVEAVFVAVQALEAWFLADTNAMSQWLRQHHHEEFPEATQGRPYERLKAIAQALGAQGPGNKPMFAKKMVKHFGFSISSAALHPQCPSALSLVSYFQPRDEDLHD